jgi:4-aminobutyrate aminotransferase/(S)-3-amino-2-methylpropionate transaminase
MNSERWKNTRERVVPQGLSITHYVGLERGEGSRVWSEDGREFLDFTSGIGALNVGHRHPRVVQAIREQLDRFMHTCFQTATYHPYVELCERLCALIGGGRGETHKALLLTTGAEATENAVKIARAFTKRSNVIAFDGAFHGRTFLALAMTASYAGYRQNFGPLPAGVFHAPYPDLYHGWTTARAMDALRSLVATQVPAHEIAAIIIEPQLGEGGFVPAPFDFLKQLRTFADEHGIVLIVDEVQSGFGRTGRMFAYEHAGIQPDLIALAKSLGGGTPIAAVVGRAEVMDSPRPGGLGGTYAGNALSCAAALAVLDVFRSEPLVARAAAIGSTIRERLLALQARVPRIGDVRGLGAMLAMELVVDRATREPDGALAERIIDHARDRGLLVLKAGPFRNVVRLLPPLTVSDEEIDRGLTLLEGAVDDSLRSGS